MVVMSWFINQHSHLWGGPMGSMGSMGVHPVRPRSNKNDSSSNRMRAGGPGHGCQLGAKLHVVHFTGVVGVHGVEKRLDVGPLLNFMVERDKMSDLLLTFLFFSISMEKAKKMIV